MWAYSVHRSLRLLGSTFVGLVFRIYLLKGFSGLAGDAFLLGKLLKPDLTGDKDLYSETLQD